MEGARRLHVRVADDGLDRAGVELAGPAVDPGVLEPVDRELRLVALLLATGQDVAVGRRRGAQEPRGELAVLEHLGVAHGDRVPRRPRTRNRTRPETF